MGPEKYKIKFVPKYPIWGLENEKIEPSNEIMEKELFYTQLTRIAKLGKKALIKDKDGNDVEFGTDMPNVLPDIVDDFNVPITSFASFTYAAGETPNVSDFTITGEVYRSEVEGQTVNFYNIENTQSITYPTTVKLTEVSIEDGINLTSIGSADTHTQPATLTSFQLVGSHKITNMSSMFENCVALTSINHFDTSNVINMAKMFKGCTALTTIPTFNTSKVTNMDDLFKGCASLTAIPLLDTSKVTSMNSIFMGCTTITSIPQLNTSSLVSANNMFYQCTALKTIPLLDFSKVTSATDMFVMSNALVDMTGLDHMKISFNLSGAVDLTAESINSIMSHLADISAVA